MQMCHVLIATNALEENVIWTDNETLRNSNRSNTDDNVNDDSIDVDNVEFDIAKDWSNKSA